MSAGRVSLREAGERLGVHYMTVYRYVRTGRLPAHRSGAVWEVDVDALARFRDDAQRSPGRRGRPAWRRRTADLVTLLVDGDETGAWATVEAALAAGAAPADVYMEMFVPALQAIGERWQRGDLGVAEEHGATTVMQRLVGRMGPRFRRRGRTRGSVVLGTPEGELHSLPTALAADLLREQGFAVIDLGANVPAGSFVDYLRRVPRVVAVGIAVTTPAARPAARRLVTALRAGGAEATIIVGGAGVDEAAALATGADAWAADARMLVELVVSG